jgi:hypothetical protein
MRCEYGTEIPTADWAAQANICDETVALAEGGTEPRYAINGSFLETEERGRVLENLLTACGGKLSCIGGEWALRVAAWYGSTPITMPDLGAMAGPMEWSPAVSSPELFNGVRAKYISPSNRWQPGDMPAYAQDTLHGYSAPPGVTGYYDINVAIDGERRWLNAEFPFTISCAAAQRLSAIMLHRSRQFGTGSFTFNLSAYQFVPQDVLAATSTFFGWTNKLLEVVSTSLRMERQSDDDGNSTAVLMVDLHVQETAASVYNWSTSEELSSEGYMQGNPPTLATPWTNPQPPPGVAHPGGSIGGLL